MIENYLNIMNESLQKKNALLDKITENCEKQEALLKQEELFRFFSILNDSKSHLYVCGVLCYFVVPCILENHKALYEWA